MASLIPGYEYDIFISYRQKDNKGDRWVSRFVEALKTELESTFKEEISVYFDINPHDGLLESYDVDASLQDKLKCLIFIPVISRTYCDPKSFAWEHEFKAFIAKGSHDQFGLKVKLPNGNVANRVLPIRIHELDNEDIILCESVLGGVLRGIEFIYKESGIDKPLTDNDDEKRNLNNTKYRIQIIKVAYAIREIIQGMKLGPESQEIRKTNVKEVFVETREEDKSKELSRIPTINQKSKKFLIILLSVVLSIIGALTLYKIIEGSKKNHDIAKLEKTIAVLPFVNDSPDQENTYFINGVMNEILNDLQKIRDFSVHSRTSVEKYRGSTKLSIPEIAKELDVNYIVEGRGQKYGNKFRLWVQLIAARNEKNLWGEAYEQEIQSTKDIFKIQSTVAQAIAEKLEISITPEEKQQIEKISTTNLTAYNFYQRGREEFYKYGIGTAINREAEKRAEILFKKALENDHTFALAYVGLGQVYWKKNYYVENYSKNFLDSMLVQADSALFYDDKLAEAHYIRGAYYWERGNDKMAENEFDKAIRFDPKLMEAYFDKGKLFYCEGDLVGSIENFQQAALRNRPKLSDLLREIGSIYYQAGFPKEGKDCNLEALNLDGDSCKYFYYLVDYEETNGNYRKALEYLTRIYRIDSTYANLDTQFGKGYMYSGQFTESLKYVKRWVEEVKAGHSLSFFGSLHQIGYVYWVNGYKNEAEYYFNKLIEYSKSLLKSSNSELIYLFAHYNLACMYAIRGDKARSYENLKFFDQKRRSSLLFVTQIKNDPFFDSFRNEPEFQQIIRNIEAIYQAEHERVRKWLEEQRKL